MLHILFASYFNGYISDIELLWTGIALFGAIFSFHNVLESRKDLDVLYVRGIKNGRRKIARTAYYNEIGRTVKQVIFFTIGIFAMTFQDAPPNPHEPIRLTIFRFLFTWGFVAAAFLTSLASYQVWSMRKELASVQEDADHQDGQDEDKQRLEDSENKATYEVVVKEA